MRAQRLSAEARHLVTRELAAGTVPRLEPDSYGRFLDECEHPVELDRFDEVCAEIIRSRPRHDSEIDRIAAPLLHRALPLSRREAANPGVWRFLAVIHRPDFVRHRWDTRSWASTRSRFWSPGTRNDSNAFSRLWWIAEITRERDSYELTERVFARSALATQLFIRGFSDHRPTVAAFVDEVGEAAAPVVERVAKDLYAAASTIAIEALEPPALRSLLATLVRESAG